MPSFVSAIGAGVSAAVSTFKRSYRTSDAAPTWKSLNSFESFNSYVGRMTRYALYWAMYENTAYDNIHSFSDSFKAEYSLYRYTRGVINPVYRLVEIWATVLMGGSLDVDAGDGRGVPSALPILTKNDRTRAAISAMWRDSLWQINKTMYCRLGAALGDVGLRVSEDPRAGMVTLDVIHPSSIRWVDKDKHGNVKAYHLEEVRFDPEFDRMGMGYREVCTYTEECQLERGSAVVRTYKNGELYDWDGNGAERDLRYPFVPFVTHPHRKMSPRDMWGWAEVHAGLTKVMESDDLSSKLNDQIRKISEGAWFITNAQPPRSKGGVLRARGQDQTDENMDPARDEMKVVYGGTGGTAVPLILPLDVQFTTLHIDFLQKIFERDYPELRFDANRVSGDASGKALREARKSAETRFIDGRAVYDDSLTRAMKMGIATGGEFGYRGYEGFSFSSLKSSELDFRIGDRTVFEVDTLDKIEEETAFWTAAETAVRSGCPLDVYLERMGWAPDQINKYMTAKERDRQTELDNQKQQAAVAAANKPAETGGKQ